MAPRTITLRRNRKRGRGFSWIWLPRLAASVFLGGALFGAAVGYEAWIRSSYFEVREIRWIGLRRLSPSEMETRLSPVIGRNIFQLDVGPIQGRLLSHPWVKESAVKKEFPDRLVFMVVERTPAAVEVDASGTEILLDDEGAPLSRGGSYPPEWPRLVHFSGGVYPQALQLARLLSDRGPVTIDLADPEDLVARLKDETLHFGNESYAERRRRFLEVENDLGRRGLSGREIDLRFPDKVIVKAGFETARELPKKRGGEERL